jgi:hypothetical protein
MQYEAVCDKICDNIARALLEMRPPTSGAAYAAACATRNIAAALHHASGLPEDPRWTAAMTSLETFLGYCHASTRALGSPALRELRGFLEENADLLAPHREHALAS